jgi:hypothetical protein
VVSRLTRQGNFSFSSQQRCNQTLAKGNALVPAVYQDPRRGIHQAQRREDLGRRGLAVELGERPGRVFVSLRCCKFELLAGIAEILRHAIAG